MLLIAKTLKKKKFMLLIAQTFKKQSVWIKYSATKEI